MIQVVAKGEHGQHDDQPAGLPDPTAPRMSWRELWLAMHHHHKRVATLQPLVADDEISFGGGAGRATWAG